MAVTIKLHSYFREISNKPSVRLEIENSKNILDMINRLTQEYDDKFREKIFNKKGELNPHIAILLNGHSIGARGGLQAPVKDGDEIWLGTIVVGG